MKVQVYTVPFAEPVVDRSRRQKAQGLLLRFLARTETAEESCSAQVKDGDAHYLASLAERVPHSLTRGAPNAATAVVA